MDALPVNLLTVGVTSRALFDLEEENRVFDTQGMDAYRRYQLDRESVILRPGPAFGLISKLQRLVDRDGDQPLFEIVVVSRNSPALSPRFFRSVIHHKLNIARSAFTAGWKVPDTLKGMGVDLFLSLHGADVREAHQAGIAAAHLFPSPAPAPEDDEHGGEIHFAFDGNSILSESGDDGGEQHSQSPFVRVLRALSYAKTAQSLISVRTSLITGTNTDIHELAIKTLRAQNIELDHSYYTGEDAKTDILMAIDPDIYFGTPG